MFWHNIMLINCTFFTFNFYKALNNSMNFSYQKLQVFGILNTFQAQLPIWTGHKMNNRPDGTRETLYLWIGYSVNNYKIQLHSSWIIEIISHSFDSVRWSRWLLWISDSESQIFYCCVTFSFCNSYFASMFFNLCNCIYVSHFNTMNRNKNGHPKHRRNDVAIFVLPNTKKPFV